MLPPWGILYTFSSPHMHKIPIKIIVFLLVPSVTLQTLARPDVWRACLLTDPVTASVISSQQISQVSILAVKSTPFETEAISPPAETSNHPFNVPSASGFRRLLERLTVRVSRKLKSTRSLTIPEMIDRREPVDLKKVAAGSNTLLIEDVRDEEGIKNFVQNQLAALKSDGFTYLAVAILPSNLQAALDQWDLAAQTKIRSYLNGKIMSAEGPAIPDAYMKLFAEAKAQHFKLIAMDDSNHLNFSTKNIAAFWMGIVGELIKKDKNAKVIILAAARYFWGDTAIGKPLSIVLKEMERSFSVVQFTSLRDFRMLQDPKEGVALESHHRGIGNETFMTVAKETAADNAPYWLVHLPKTAKRPLKFDVEHIERASWMNKLEESKSPPEIVVPEETPDEYVDINSLTKDELVGYSALQVLAHDRRSFDAPGAPWFNEASYRIAIGRLIDNLGEESFIRITQVIFDQHLKFIRIPEETEGYFLRPYSVLDVKETPDEKEIESVRDMVGEHYRLPDSIFLQRGTVEFKTLFGDKLFWETLRDYHPRVFSRLSALTKEREVGMPLALQSEFGRLNKLIYVMQRYYLGAYFTMKRSFGIKPYIMPGSYLGTSRFRALYVASLLEEAIRALLYSHWWLNPASTSHDNFIEATFLFALVHYFLNRNAYRKLFTDRWGREPPAWELIVGTLAIPVVNNMLSLIPLAFHWSPFYYYLFNTFQHHIVNRFAFYEELMPASLMGARDPRLWTQTFPEGLIRRSLFGNVKMLKGHYDFMEMFPEPAEALIVGAIPLHCAYLGLRLTIAEFAKVVQEGLKVDVGQIRFAPDRWTALVSAFLPEGKPPHENFINVIAMVDRQWIHKLELGIGLPAEEILWYVYDIEDHRFVDLKQMLLPPLPDGFQPDRSPEIWGADPQFFKFDAALRKTAEQVRRLQRAA